MAVCFNGQRWNIHHGDCIPWMEDQKDGVMDFAVFSPPFPSIFAYTDKPEDLGNCNELKHEAKLHFSFFFKQLRRIMKPGRVVVVHCTQIKRMARNNESGMFDFRGLLIRLAQRAGFIYEYDWLVGKNPQAQAIRTHSHELLFVTLERDRASSRGVMGDYLIKLIVPGANEVPINSGDEISRKDWIDWAECHWPWTDVRETDTLNTGEAKGEDDTKHICPLQLKVIRRLVKLYTNPNEVVFSPFAGIGSEGYCSLQLGRMFWGCEIKDEYVDAARVNCDKAENMHGEQLALFPEEVS